MDTGCPRPGCPRLREAEAAGWAKVPSTKAGTRLHPALTLWGIRKQPSGGNEISCWVIPPAGRCEQGQRMGSEEEPQGVTLVPPPISSCPLQCSRVVLRLPLGNHQALREAGERLASPQAAPAPQTSEEQGGQC